MSEIHGLGPIGGYPIRTEEDKVKNALVFLNSLIEWAKQGGGNVQESDVNAMVDLLNAVINDRNLRIDPRDLAQLKSLTTSLSNTPHDEINDSQVNTDTLDQIKTLLSQL